ncbi:hypothetical protein HHI36_006567 [Cryptolaemus montrouzieri]|uniref:Uncharacterized protein n=1 Tax=Cryptolaemus montrouzieri TaxID=559131 RepID=A0ABD2NYI6_9CUCU
MAEAEEGEITDNELTEEEEGEGEEGEEGLANENEKLIQELEKESIPGSEKPSEAAMESEKPSKATMQSEIPPESAALKGKIDDKTIEQLEQIEKESKEAANVINELKTRIQELLQKEKMTKEEEKELEELNTELNKQMELFEEKTKQIQEIITDTNILTGMPARLPQAKHEEDVLPRVILCGFEEEYVPKIVVCDQKVKGVGGAHACMPGCPGPSPPPCVPSFTKQLCENYNIKDKLATENADLEKIKSRLEADITNKDRILDNLQMKLATLQNEIRMVSAENAMLNEKIRNVQQNQMRQKQESCKPKKPCPAVLAGKLQEYSDYTRRLERQLAEMERDFNAVHKEICTIQKQRGGHGQTSNTMGMSSCYRSQR